MIAEEGLSAQVAEYIEHTVWLAKTLGVDTITMSGPNRKTTPADIDWESTGKPRYIEVLRYYADKCKEAGLDLLIEPINEQEQSYIATVAAAESVVHAVQKDNVGIILDYFHFIMQNDHWEDVLRLCANGTIRHIHFAEPENRIYPVREHLAQYREVLHAMKEAGYNGRISVEAFAHGELEKTLHEGLQVLQESLQ